MGYRSRIRVLLCSALVSALSACTYILPDDPSAPRYNSVMGERHRPVRNVAVESRMPLPAAPAGMTADMLPSDLRAPQEPTPYAMASPPPADARAPLPAPVMPVTQQALPPLPPVDPMVQARAAEEIRVASVPVAERQMPVENQAFEMAQFNNLPPQPPAGTHQDIQQRTNAMRGQLEQERIQAQQQQMQLRNDAAAEPSLMPPAPAPPAPPAPMQLTPPAPVMTPPPPPQAFSPMDYPQIAMPAEPRMLPPIQLTPPAPQVTTTAVAPMPPAHLPPTDALTTPSGFGLPASGGAFDPLAPAPLASAQTSYANGNYLPESRYTR